MMQRLYSYIEKIYFYVLRSLYFNRLRQLISNNVSIISNNCTGSRICQDLKYKYNSPTVGLFFYYPDYILFLSHLKEYISSDLLFKNESRFLDSHNSYTRNYPIGSIIWKNEEVEIHFLHYHSEDEARNKWKRRCERINWDNLLFIGSECDYCTEEDIKKFSELEYENKIFFTAKHYKNIDSSSIVYVSSFEKEGKVQGYKYAHKLYPFLCKIDHVN